MDSSPITLEYSSGPLVSVLVQYISSILFLDLLWINVRIEFKPIELTFQAILGAV